MEEEILLTEETYKKIMDSIISEIVKLKQSQGQTVNKISVEIETLKELKKLLKQTKKDIKMSKKNLNNYRWNLAKTNDSLRSKYDLMKGLSDQYISEEESYIDLNYFSNDESKKR